MDNKIKELKDLLWEFDNKHSVSVPDTHENINNIAERIVKLFAIPELGAVNSDPAENGYYLTKTEENKWGIAYWDGNKFWDDPAQDGKLSFGIRRDFIKEWYLLPY